MQAFLLAVILGVFTLIGFIVGKDLKSHKKIIDFSFGLSFVVMLFITIFKMIPWAYKLLSHLDVLPDIKTFVGISDFGIIVLIISVIIGFLVLKLIDSFIPNHEIKARNHNAYLEHIAIVSCIAIMCYSVMSSMMVYVTVLDSFKKGLLLSISVGLLNVPLGLFISLLFNNQHIRIPKIILSIGPLVGGILMLLLVHIISEALVGVLISVTIGMFIFVLVSELIKPLKNCKEKKNMCFGIITGICLGFISILLG